MALRPRAYWRILSRKAPASPSSAKSEQPEEHTPTANTTELSRVGDAVGLWVVGLWVGILVISLIGALVHLLPFAFEDFVVVGALVPFPFAFEDFGGALVPFPFPAFEDFGGALVPFPFPAFEDFGGALVPFPGEEMGSSSQLSSS